MDVPAFVVPSYNRLDTLADKTYAFLRRHNIPEARIHIFAAPSEYLLYKHKFPAATVVCGELGLKNQRNCIARHFPEGAPLVCLDDDIEDLYELSGGTLTPVPDFAALVDAAFARTRDLGFSLWGIYPCKNAFYMKPDWSTNLKFCIGHLWGVFNRRDILLTLDYKDDYERTLLYFLRDKGMVRLNNIAAKTRMGRPGGMGLAVQQRLAQNTQSSAYLVQTYPNLVRLNTRRPGEVLLKARRGA